jgi:dTDP-4-dehydrorhamnose 3,5-epimerase-like enzyme
MYKVDQFYKVESEGSIAPNDPALGIDWQIA